jgi:branched-chain amino acid transport system ATP-binding protein
MEAVLSLRGISKRFGGNQALQDLSLDVPLGQIFGLIGPNGAGKTTVLNIATGLYRPDSGGVLVAGQDVTVLKPYERSRKGLSRTFQGGRPFGQLTVRENVQIAIEQRKKIEGADTSHGPPQFCADELLSDVGLLQDGESSAQSLPYGKQKQLEIARAIAYATSVLLLDEPTSGLSAEEIKLVAAIIARYRRDLGILLIEHNMDVVMSLCDQIMVIDAGSWVATGTPAEIQTHPQVLAAYLGT